MQFALAGWTAVSLAVLGTGYMQMWNDGKSANPAFISAVAPKDEVAMLAWMKANLPHDRLVLAPENMAPWVATIPMPSVGSHDLFSVTYQAQRDLAAHFYQGQPLRTELIDHFGISYVVAPNGAPIKLDSGKLLHQEAGLRLFEIPGEHMQPYPGIAHIAGAPAPSPFRQWVLRILGKLGRSSA
jgi:hypothetical protein